MIHAPRQPALRAPSQHDSRPNRPVLRHGGRDDFASVKPQRGVAVGRHMAAQSHRLVFCGNVEVLQIGSVRTSDPRRTSTPTPPPTRPPALHPQLRRACFRGIPTWSMWWAATKSTNAPGQPIGQSIPVLQACWMASRMTSSAGWITSRMVARLAVHPILASAGRSGIAARPAGQ